MKRREFLNSSLGLAAASTVAARSPVRNPEIESGRAAALAVLKPSPKDLNHGLELHANSIVIEPYGFSPFCAVDGAAIRAAIEAGASAVELEDLREEMYMTRSVSDPAERQEFMQAWDAAGVTAVFQNAGEEGQDPLRLMKRLARYTYVSDMLSGFAPRAIDADDVVAAKKQNRHCMFFATCGVPLTQSWISVQDELRYIRIFFQLGVRMMHLTYNRRNMIGDGCAEPANAGLSDFGRAVIAEMNRVGVLVDVAHSGWRTSLEAAKASARPMVASHSACAALNQHFRCKPDEVIRAIADTSGFLGVCAIPNFIGGDISAMLNHIDYVARRFGVDHVAIATDVPYTSRAAEVEESKIPSRGGSRAAWEFFWPQNPYAGYEEERRTLAWTNWPLFTVGLVQRGYSDDDIQKILGGNVLRVARAVFPKRIQGTAG